MNLGIFLTSGDSFQNMAKSGQDILFKKFYLSYFAKNFSQIYVFSYARENVKDLPKNVQVIPNKYNLHRYLYSLLMPFLNLTLVSNCDVIRVYHLFGTIPAIITKFFYGKSYVFNFAYNYEKFAQIEGKFFQRLLLVFLEPLAILFSRKIFVANKSIFKKLSRDKAVYLPNGVDTDFFKPAKIKKKNKIPAILSVGRLEKQKNFEVLVEAMRGINARLVIVGQGSLKEKLEKLANENNIDLEIITEVKNIKMPQIYSSADIFVLPSYIEGSPKVLLEAMSCGLPVIGTNVEGIDEILNVTNGRKCSSSRESINEAVNYLIKNPSYRVQIGKKARKFIVNNFNLGVLLQKEIKVIKEAS